MNINEQANFIWSIADLLRGDFKQSEYGKVILNANRAPLKKSENILVFYQKSPVYHPQFTYGEPYRRVYSRSGSSSNYPPALSHLWERGRLWRIYPRHALGMAQPGPPVKGKPPQGGGAMHP